MNKYQGQKKSEGLKMAFLKKWNELISKILKL